MDNFYRTDNPEITFANETFRYIPERDTVVGRVDGQDALTQSLYFILMTDRYVYPIFNRDYGIDLDGIIGGTFEDVYNKLPYRIIEALERDDRVLSILDIEIEQIDETSAYVNILIEDIFESNRLLQFGFDFG